MYAALQKKLRKYSVKYCKVMKGKSKRKKNKFKKGSSYYCSWLQTNGDSYIDVKCLISWILGLFFAYKFIQYYHFMISFIRLAFLFRTPLWRLVIVTRTLIKWLCLLLVFSNFFGSFFFFLFHLPIPSLREKIVEKATLTLIILL